MNCQISERRIEEFCRSCLVWCWLVHAVDAVCLFVKNINSASRPWVDVLLGPIIDRNLVSTIISMHIINIAPPRKKGHVCKNVMTPHFPLYFEVETLLQDFVPSMLGRKSQVFVTWCLSKGSKWKSWKPQQNDKTYQKWLASPEVSVWILVHCGCSSTCSVWFILIYICNISKNCMGQCDFHGQGYINSSEQRPWLLLEARASATQRVQQQSRGVNMLV